MTKKNFGKRKVVYYGPVTAQIDIIVAGNNELQPDEVKFALDILADKAMEAMRDTRYIHAPLSRIKVERSR